MELMGFKESIELLHQTGVLHLFAFAMGASVGSFLNVFIYRWPQEMSVVTPGSHCPSCDRPLPWYLNIPILSWIMLRGRCRFCGAPISSRYLVIELLGGLWGVVCLWHFGPGLEAIALFVVGSALLGASVIDLEHRLLPDVVTLGSIPLALAMAFLPRPWVPAWPVNWYEGLLGMALGGGIFFFVLFVFQRATGKEGMGLGDVKLMAGMGALVGYQAVPTVILLSSVAGIAAWAVLRALQKADRDYMVPFGPFISAAAMVVMVGYVWLERQWLIFRFIDL